MNSFDCDAVVALGDPLPDIELADLGGKRWRMSDLKGLATVLFLFSSW